MEAKPTQYAMIMEAQPTPYAMIMEAKPTQYAMIMEAKPTQYAMIKESHRLLSAATVMMRMYPSTTEFPIGLDTMGRTVQSPGGSTNRSAFPARHSV